MKKSILKKYDPDFSTFFRFKKFDEDTYLLTTESGNYAFLKKDDFEKFVTGSLEKDSDAYKLLKEKNFIKPEFVEKTEVERYRLKNHFLFLGPVLHIVITTLRCNHTCLYCHASRKPEESYEYDLNEETAEKILEKIFKSPSPAITIEFQGGEPLLNFKIVKYIIERAVEINKGVGKQIQFSLVSNFSAMDEEKFQFLMENKVQFCTSLDGPEELHNKNRIYTKGNSFKETVYWIKRINEEYKKLNLDPDVYHVEALLTVTKYSLPYWKEIVDTYVSLGFNTIYLRPLNPFGFAKNLSARIGYTASEFIEFYTKALDYILKLNAEGVEILERMASLFLVKILNADDPNFLDLRSPCGAGIGQIAYNYDGKVFTCDEGRMVYQMGDDAFLMGDVFKNSYSELLNSESVKSTIIASELEGVPNCSTCVYRPYCGICPVYNYSEQGSLTGLQRLNDRCKINMAILNFLFEKLKEDATMNVEVFKKWAVLKDREFYLEH